MVDRDEHQRRDHRHVRQCHEAAGERAEGYPHAQREAAAALREGEQQAARGEAAGARSGEVRREPEELARGRRKQQLGGNEPEGEPAQRDRPRRQEGTQIGARKKRQGQATAQTCTPLPTRS